MSCEPHESAEIEATLAKETLRPGEGYSHMVPFAASLAPNPFQRRDPLALSSLRFSRGAGSERERRISRRTEILRCAQDDTAASASFDWQHVFFSWNCVTT